MVKDHILASDRLGPLLAKLSVPAMVGMLMMGLYNLVDTIFVGRGVGTLGIGGIAIVFPMQIAVLAVGLLLGIGTASVVSRSLGAGDRERAAGAFGNMVLAIFACSALVTACGYLWLDPLLKLFGATPAILPFARDYMQIALMGVFFQLFAMASNNIIRAEGKARVAMYTMTIGALLNIALDPIFIFGLGLGMRGAALATVISQFVSAAWILGFFASGRSDLQLQGRHFRLEVALLGEALAVGASSFTRQISGSILAMVLNHILGGFGDLQVAVFGVINRLLILGIMPLVGIAQGLQPIAGFNYGAQRYDKVRRVIRLAITSASISAGCVFLCYMIFPTPLIGIFTKDGELIAGSAHALRLIILGMPFLGIQMIGSTTFQALGRARAALLLTLSRQVLFLVPLVLILPKILGLNGVWLAFPLADLLSIFLTLSLLLPLLRSLRSREQQEKDRSAKALSD